MLRAVAWALGVGFGACWFADWGARQDLGITLADNPTTQAWEGAADWSRSDAFGAVSRRDYEEGGADYCQERFGNNWPGLAQAGRRR